MNPFWGADRSRVRAMWGLDDAVVHLNHGSFGAVPVAAMAEQQRLRTLMERDPDRWFRWLPGLVAEARVAIAGYLGAEPDALALVPNASAGVTVVLDSLDAAAGGQIVYTDHAYGAVELAVRRTCRRLGLRPRRVDVPLAADTPTVVPLVGAALDGPTSLVVVDRISSATARCFPVRELAELCRDRGVPILVDGAHAPGMVDDPLDDDVDFWVGNLHKWSCAPRGTAALVAAARRRDRLRPLISSWASDEPYPQRFDMQGTLDLTAWLAAPTALAELAALGEERVRSHNRALVEHGQRVICDAVGAPVPDVGEPAPSMRLVPLPDGVGATLPECHALQTRIAETAGCEVAITNWRDRGFLRLSAHAYNTPTDFDTLAAHLQPGPALLRGDHGPMVAKPALPTTTSP